MWKLLKTEEDWKKYQGIKGYSNGYGGEPREYPCLIDSYPNGTWSIKPFFVYFDDFKRFIQ